MCLSEISKEKLSPGMRQYVEVKEQNPDCILFFRLGDFYEMFFDDAILVSRELELTLTGKECGLEERAPMCGVPYHSVDIYLKRLVDKGYKIAICEQLSDPATSKGLVDRDVVRIVTPGTLIDSTMLEDDANNFIGCLYEDEAGSAMVFSDLSTGEMILASLSQEGDNLTTEILDMLSRYMPSELLLNKKAMERKSIIDFIKIRLQCTITLREDSCFEADTKMICEQFHVDSIEMLCITKIPEKKTVSAMLDYIRETQKNSIARFVSLEIVDNASVMGLDISARRNLELTEMLRHKERKGSLYWLLDDAKTAMGKRLLKVWIEQPLVQPVKIMARLDAVGSFVDNSIVLMEVRDILDSVYDLERLMTRVIYQKATPRDLKALSATALQLPALKEQLKLLSSSKLLTTLNQQISTLKRVATLIENAIVDEPPISMKDGGVIKPHFNEELDRYRTLINGGKDTLNQILERE